MSSSPAEVPAIASLAALRALDALDAAVDAVDVDRVASMLAVGEQALGALAGGALAGARLAAPMSIHDHARAAASRDRYHSQLQQRVADRAKGPTDG